MARYGSREIERGAAGRRCLGEPRRDQGRRRPRRPESVEVSRVVEEGQVARAGLIERGDVVDDAASVRSGGKVGAAPVRDLGQRRRAALRKEADLGQTNGSVRCDDGRVSP